MRNVARLKMGYYPLPESEGVKLRYLLSYSEPASVIDPCVGQGTALQIITKDAPARLYGVELDAERARIASSKGIEAVQGIGHRMPCRCARCDLAVALRRRKSEVWASPQQCCERLVVPLAQHLRESAGGCNRIGHQVPP